MRQPSKWRETIDPFSLTFNRFTLSEVLGYPHAGNDVFYVEGSLDGNTVRAFIKVETLTGSDFTNELGIIQQLPFPFVPKVLDYSLEKPRFIVTEELPGERLSFIVGDNANKESLQYLLTYGEMLGKFHKLEVDCQPVKDRRFFHIKPKAYFETNGLLDVYNYLNSHQPGKTDTCFVHGDFHYANILWKDQQISAVLDYELAGIGVREFDLAWACCLRPGQKFLDSMEEVELFLEGYQSENDFSRESFNYYFTLIASWFYSFGKDEPGFQEKLKTLIQAVIREAQLL